MQSSNRLSMTELAHEYKYEDDSEHGGRRFDRYGATMDRDIMPSGHHLPLHTSERVAVAMTTNDNTARPGSISTGFGFVAMTREFPVPPVNTLGDASPTLEALQKRDSVSGTNQRYQLELASFPIPSRTGAEQSFTTTSPRSQPRPPFPTMDKPKTRASSIAHELDMRPSLAQRRLSPHQILLLTPFGRPAPLPTKFNPTSPAMGMHRQGASLGDAGAMFPTARGDPARSGWQQSSMVPQQSHTPGVQMTRARVRVSAPATRRGSGLANMNTLHEGDHVFQDNSMRASGLNESLSGHHEEVFESSELGSAAGSRRTSDSLSTPELEMDSANLFADPAPRSGGRPMTRSNAGDREVRTRVIAAPAPPSMMLGTGMELTRSHSMPILTSRELEALREKEVALSIRRTEIEGWAWVSGAPGDGLGDGKPARAGSRRPSMLYNSPRATFNTFAHEQPPSGMPLFSDPFRVDPFTSLSTSSQYSPGPMPNLGRFNVELPGRRASAAGLFDADLPSSAEQNIGYPAILDPAPPLRPRMTRYKTSPGDLEHSPKALSKEFTKEVEEPRRESVATNGSGEAGTVSSDGQSSGGQPGSVVSSPRRDSSTKGSESSSAEHNPLRRGSWASIHLVDAREMAILAPPLRTSPAVLRASSGTFMTGRGRRRSSLAQETILQQASRLRLGGSLDIGQPDLPSESHGESETRRASDFGPGDGRRPSWEVRDGQLNEMALFTQLEGSGVSTTEVKKAWYERRGSWAEGL